MFKQFILQGLNIQGTAVMAWCLETELAFNSENQQVINEVLLSKTHNPKLLPRRFG